MEIVFQQFIEVIGGFVFLVLIIGVPIGLVTLATLNFCSKLERRKEKRNGKDR